MAAGAIPANPFGQLPPGLAQMGQQMLQQAMQNPQAVQQLLGNPAIQQLIQQAIGAGAPPAPGAAPAPLAGILGALGGAQGAAPEAPAGAAAPGAGLLGALGGAAGLIPADFRNRVQDGLVAGITTLGRSVGREYQSLSTQFTDNLAYMDSGNIRLATSIMMKQIPYILAETGAAARLNDAVGASLFRTENSTRDKITARLDYAEMAVSSFASSIYHLALALIFSLGTLFTGFQNETAKTLAKRYWVHTASSLGLTGAGFAGIFTPTAGATVTAGVYYKLLPYVLPATLEEALVTSARSIHTDMRPHLEPLGINIDFALIERPLRGTVRLVQQLVQNGFRSVLQAAQEQGGLAGMMGRAYQLGEAPAAAAPVQAQG